MKNTLTPSLPIGPESAKPIQGSAGIRRVVVVFNERSGRGRAADAVRRLTRLMAHEGLESRTIGLAEALGGLPEADAIVIAGGDGTVRALAPSAIASGTPIHHLPLGTENLFARELGMSRDSERLIRALREGLILRVDVGVLDGTPFVLMAGFGTDADVVARLQARRRGPISHASYLVPILQTLARPRFPRLVVRAEGRTVVDGAPGLLVIANSRQYGARLDPASMASMTDGRLDMVFMPCASRARALAWAAACRFGAQPRRRGFIHEAAARFEVQSLDGPLSIQVDGEPGPGDRARVEIAVRPRALAVLIPSPTG